MAQSSPLVGPPEIHHLPLLSAVGGGGGNANATDDPTVSPNPPAAPAVDADNDDECMDDLVSQTDNLDLAGIPPMGLTENSSATFLSSGNPCLDFFFHVVPDTPREDLIGRLKSAWTHDPLTTLKLICNLRGVRGTGKTDKEGFYTAAIWIHENHPKTLAGNVGSIADFGYFKDLLEILYRILEGPQVRQLEKQLRSEKSMEKRIRLSSAMRGKRGERSTGTANRLRGTLRGKKVDVKFKRENRVETKDEAKEERIARNSQLQKEEQEKARALRKEKEIAKARKALEKYNHDSNYRFLYDQISILFAVILKSDLENLNSGKLNKISLAGKWCPTIDSSYDKSTLICEAIAKKLFPRETCPEYDSIEENHYAFRVRDRLRKEVLVPLHKALELPEVYMSANQWGSLPYNRVASVAMKNNKEHFLKHDGERFKQYLEDVKSGKAKIAAGALLPHEIIAALTDGEEDSGEVAELQWRRMVDDLSKKGKLTNCIAVCDVSGSMSGTPMEVSVALGVLVSELSEEPWKGKLITFSADPELQKVEGDTLLAKTKFVRNMNWGMNTNFQKVFDRILEVAVEGKLSEEQMIKRVFVFSDMEFDQASKNDWETDYMAIQRKFREKEYRNVPEIVFWNLRDSRSTPVMASQSGVALVSGFSKNLLTIFLEGGGAINPEEVMEIAIRGEEYKKLAVFD